MSTNDPLDVLRSGVDLPVAPRPEFADALLTVVLDELGDDAPATPRRRSSWSRLPGLPSRRLVARFGLVPAAMVIGLLLAGIATGTYIGVRKWLSPDTPPVTIKARAVVARPDQPRSASRRQVVLSGTVAGGIDGQAVQILSRDCGPAHASRAYSPIGTTETATGGGWRFVVRDSQRSPAPRYFRARSNGALSDPLLVRRSLRPSWTVILERKGFRVLHAEFDTRDTGQDLTGRIVQLQGRHVGPVSGRVIWVPLRPARLRRVAGHYEANFVIREDAETLRIYLSGGQAAPCYRAGASAEFPATR